MMESNEWTFGTHRARSEAPDLVLMRLEGPTRLEDAQRILDIYREVGTRQPFFGTLFEQLGCATEASHVPGLIAVDVPPSVPLARLKPLLDSGRAEERWDYEEGCLGQE